MLGLTTGHNLAIGCVTDGVDSVVLTFAKVEKLCSAGSECEVKVGVGRASRGEREKKTHEKCERNDDGLAGS